MQGVSPKQNVYWKSRNLRKRVAIIRVKWPLLLPTREALADPKQPQAACGNSELVERIRVKVISGMTQGHVPGVKICYEGWHRNANPRHYAA